VGVGEGQEEEEEEAEAKEGKGKNKWWWWLDKCTSRACGATTTDNATGNSAPPGHPCESENFANMTLSTAGFKLLAPPSWQLNGWHWNLPPIVNLASRALNGV
jgi:hypothetical protein